MQTTEATELRIVPRTTWVRVGGYHPGGVVQIRRVTERAVYYKVIREGAMSGPRPRKSGSLKTRFDRAEFLRNYRPYTKRDWMLATVGPAISPEETEEETEHVNGRLHDQEEAIAEAIRSGVKYHAVQGEYHVNGKTIQQIIEKYEVPYRSQRQAAEDRKPAPDPVTVPIVDKLYGEPHVPLGPIVEPVIEREFERRIEAMAQQLHPQEDEIVELMRSRVATFQEVLRTYHLKSSTLAALMAKHDIPKQTVEEKRAKSRAYYHQQKARQAEAEEARRHLVAEIEQELRPRLEADRPVFSQPEPSPASLEEMPEVDMTGARRGHYARARRQQTWQITMRTTVIQTYDAASYLAAATAALAENPDAEILSLVRIEGDMNDGG